METLKERMLEAHKFWTTVKGEDVVSGQRDFPNCGKYTHCCDEGWSEKIERVLEVPEKLVSYNVVTERQAIREPKKVKPPEGFENIPEDLKYGKNKY